MENLIIVDDGWRGRIAYIRNNIVIDVFENAPRMTDGIHSETAQIGDIYKDGEFIKPEPIPEEAQA